MDESANIEFVERSRCLRGVDSREDSPRLTAKNLCPSLTFTGRVVILVLVLALHLVKC